MKKLFTSLMLLVITALLAYIEYHTICLPNPLTLSTEILVSVGVMDFIFLIATFYASIIAAKWSDILWLVVGIVMLTIFLLEGFHFIEYLGNFVRNLTGQQMYLGVLSICLYYLGILFFAVYTFANVYCRIEMKK